MDSLKRYIRVLLYRFVKETQPRGSVSFDVEGGKKM